MLAIRALPNCYFSFLCIFPNNLYLTNLKFKKTYSSQPHGTFLLATDQRSDNMTQNKAIKKYDPLVSTTWVNQLFCLYTLNQSNDKHSALHFKISIANTNQCPLNDADMVMSFFLQSCNANYPANLDDIRHSISAQFKRKIPRDCLRQIRWMWPMGVEFPQNQYFFAVIRIDDLCNESMACYTKHGTPCCQKIHVIARQMFCPLSIQHDKYHCGSFHCTKLHVATRSVVDMLIETITNTLNDPWIQGNHPWYKDFTVSTYKLRNKWVKCFRDMPVPIYDRNNWPMWHRLLTLYSDKMGTILWELQRSGEFIKLVISYPQLVSMVCIPFFECSNGISQLKCNCFVANAVRWCAQIHLTERMLPLGPLQNCNKLPHIQSKHWDLFRRPTVSRVWNYLTILDILNCIAELLTYPNGHTWNQSCWGIQTVTNQSKKQHQISELLPYPAQDIRHCKHINNLSVPNTTTATHQNPTKGYCPPTDMASISLIAPLSRHISNDTLSSTVVIAVNQTPHPVMLTDRTPLKPTKPPLLTRPNTLSTKRRRRKKKQKAKKQTIVSKDEFDNASNVDWQIPRPNIKVKNIGSHSCYVSSPMLVLSCVNALWRGVKKIQSAFHQIHEQKAQKIENELKTLREVAQNNDLYWSLDCCERSVQSSCMMCALGTSFNRMRKLRHVEKTGTVEMRELYKKLPLMCKDFTISSKVLAEWGDIVTIEQTGASGDVSLFINTLLSTLHDIELFVKLQQCEISVDSVNQDTSWVRRLFTTKFQTCRICHTCNSRTYAPINGELVVNISLVDLHSLTNKSLTGLLQSKCKKEIMKGSNKVLCHKCNVKRNFTFKSCIHSVSQFIIFNFLRQKIKHNGSKNNEVVKCNHTIDIGQFMGDKQTIMYELVAKCVHKRRHWFTIIKTDSIGSTWTKIDDEKCNEISAQAAFAEQNCVLWYRKM